MNRNKQFHLFLCLILKNKANLCFFRFSIRFFMFSGWFYVKKYIFGVKNAPKKEQTHSILGLEWVCSSCAYRTKSQNRKTEIKSVFLPGFGSLYNTPSLNEWNHKSEISCFALSDMPALLLAYHIEPSHAFSAQFCKILRILSI